MICDEIEKEGGGNAGEFIVNRAEGKVMPRDESSEESIAEWFGATSDRGRRETQQDEYLIVENLFEGHPRATLFCVFDGHGSEGGRVSSYVKKVFPEVLRQRRSAFGCGGREAATALRSAFSTVNSMLTENPAIDTYMSGSTAAVVIILHEDRCALIASVGDSRIILGRRDGDDVVAEQITTDHTCADDEELDRVTKNGARVEQMLTEDGKDGPLRIYKGTLPYPGLVVTRSLGDTCAIKLGVLCDPEVFERELSKRDRFFILASDGLWDGLDNGQVVKVVDKYESPQKASEVLNRKALKSLDAKAIDDNVTNVVVYLE